MTHRSKLHHAMIAAGLLAATAGILAQTGAPPREPVKAEPAAPERIAWMAWSDESFARAAAEGKPILLSISALWARASLYEEERIYTDPQVVKLVNERWIPIKVDRDRRPDIDLRYQLAVNTVSRGDGGWPLTAFLDDKGEVMFGRSYIPLEDRRETAGLRTLLKNSADLYTRKREAAGGSIEVARKAFDREKAEVREPAVSLGVVQEIASAMSAALDKEHGGFGPPPRVPSLFALELAGTLYARTGNAAYRDTILIALEGMEEGAIFDRVGGGFHRGSTDPAWRLPDFEKLLSYNAWLLTDYLMGFEALGDVDFRITAEKTLDYILGTLRDPAGGFYVAQRASAAADESRGAYYSWSDDEFRKLVPPAQAKLAATLFHVTPEGDLLLGQPPRNLLYLAMNRKEAAERLGVGEQAVRDGEAAILAALGAIRAGRSAPPVQKEIYIDSSSAAVVSLLQASRVLGNDRALSAGLEALDRMLAAIPASGPLRHRLQPSPDPAYDPSLALDHIMLARAALAGYEETSRRSYLAAAKGLIDRAVTLFWDDKEGCFMDVAQDPNARGYLALRRNVPADTAYPSLNSEAALVLDRMALVTGDPTYRGRSERCLKRLVAVSRMLDYRNAGLALALEAHLRPPTRYVVVGGRDDPKSRELLRAARGVFDPGKLVLMLDPREDEEEISKLKIKKARGTYAVICGSDRCSEPTTDGSKLAPPQPGR